MKLSSAEMLFLSDVKQAGVTGLLWTMRNSGTANKRKAPPERG